MTTVSYLLRFAMLVSFIGITVYCAVGAWYSFDTADYAHPPTRRELMNRIPPDIRRLGKFSIGLFLGCLLVGAVLAFASK